MAALRVTARTTPQQLLRKLFPPMLATLTGEPPADDSNWIYELKYDGFRAVAALVGGQLALWSRNELDLEPRFPHIAQALAKLKGKNVVLDGEIVAVDAAGVPRFQLLQGGAHRERIFIFDLLWLDGEDLRKRPYVERRAILEKILRRPPAGVEIAEQIPLGGTKALEKAALAGWEGIIAKRRTSVYEARRSKEWLKVKAINQQEFVIVGWNPSSATAREVGALHLAVTGEDGELHYAGKVGTGFTSKMRAELKQTLVADEVPKPLVKEAPRYRDAHWVRPRLVGQVSFTEWTDDNKLRHPSFLGLRQDKSPSEVVREKVLSEHAPKSKGRSTAPRPDPTNAEGRRQKAEGRNQKPETRNQKGMQRAADADAAAVMERPPKRAAAKKTSAGSKKAPAAKVRAGNAAVVNITHPERVLYPRDNITKADVAAYYEAVSAPMTNALRDRPLALEHWNQGIDQPSWFHQNLGREAPEWMTTIDTPTRTSARRTVRHLVADTPEALRWLAQMSVLTVHMWASRGDSLDSPDWIVFDLDPAKGKGIEQAIEAAIIMRGLLENLQLPSVPKTSGKRGIHVVVPLAPGYTHEQAGEFACSIAAAVAREVPWMTVERALGKRQGRLYLDCMQNAYGKTIVAPYSLRALDGAPVSAPLKWEEVNRKLDPLKFNLRTMPKRLAKVGDLFARALEKGAKLPELQ